MQLSSSIIKSSSVVNEGKKYIFTEFDLPNKEDNDVEESSVETVAKEQNALRDPMEEYKRLAKTMFDSYRKKGEEILNKAKEEAEVIKKDAYDTSYKKGYEEGEHNGYEDAYKNAYEKAYKEGYEENIVKANKEREELIKDGQQISDNLIKSAREEYVAYIEEKKQEIKDMIENIVEHVFKKELEDKAILNNMILDVVNHAKNSKNIVVKSRQENIEEIKNAIDEWKQTNIFKGDIFIIEDDSLQNGVAIVEKDNGKTEIDIKKALDKVREILICSD